MNAIPSRADFQRASRGLSPTQQDPLGEKHFRPDAPKRQWLHPMGEPGERFWMPGSVKQENGQPIAGARVEFCVANDKGEYSEEGFDGRGWQNVDDSGSYQLHCIRPSSPDPKKAAYINARISAPGFEPLSTRLFFEDDIHNRHDPGFDKSRELELGSLHWGNTKFFTAEFDFILKAKEDSAE